MQLLLGLEEQVEHHKQQIQPMELLAQMVATQPLEFSVQEEVLVVIRGLPQLQLEAQEAQVNFLEAQAERVEGLPQELMPQVQLLYRVAVVVVE